MNEVLAVTSRIFQSAEIATYKVHIPIKFVTAERNAVPYATRNIPSLLAPIV